MLLSILCFFFSNDPSTTEIYTLSLHDALPISRRLRAAVPELHGAVGGRLPAARGHGGGRRRSEEHTSELQSRLHLVCRLLLEKKKTKKIYVIRTKYARTSLGLQDQVLHHNVR